MSLIPGLGRSPGGGNGYPLRYSCLGNPTDRGAWQATIHGVTKSQTQLKHLSTHTPEIDNKIRKQKPQQLLHTSLSPAAVTNCCNFLEGPGPTGPSLSKFFISQFAQDSLPQVEVQPWATRLLKLPRDSHPENTGAGRPCTLGRQPTDTPGPVTCSGPAALQPGLAAQTTYWH